MTPGQKELMEKEYLDFVKPSTYGNKANPSSCDSLYDDVENPELRVIVEKVAATTPYREEASTNEAQSPPNPLKRISGKQRKATLEEYQQTFLQVPRIDDRKPVFVSSVVRDRLDRVVRILGGRRMSVSGIIVNIERHHLSRYDELRNTLKLSQLFSFTHKQAITKLPRYTQSVAWLHSVHLLCTRQSVNGAYRDHYTNNLNKLSYGKNKRNESVS